MKKQIILIALLVSVTKVNAQDNLLPKEVKNIVSNGLKKEFVSSQKINRKITFTGFSKDSSKVYNFVGTNINDSTINFNLTENNYNKKTKQIIQGGEKIFDSRSVIVRTFCVNHTGRPYRTRHLKPLSGVIPEYRPKCIWGEPEIVEKRRN